eukprot:11120483-Ditylum_brightwellii.AAC.1
MHTPQSTLSPSSIYPSFTMQAMGTLVQSLQSYQTDKVGGMATHIVNIPQQQHKMGCATKWQV